MSHKLVINIVVDQFTIHDYKTLIKYINNGLLCDFRVAHKF